MNSLGIMAVWGIVQVSAVALFALLCYSLVRRRAAAARSDVVATSLAVTLLVTILAVSPWPRWFSISPEDPSSAPRIATTSTEKTVSQSAPESAGPSETPTSSRVSAKPPGAIDVAGTFWQTLLRELSEPTAAETSVTRSYTWPVIVAAGLVVAMLLGSARLLAGLWGVRQLQIGSHALADGPLLAEVERLRRQLGVAKSVEVRTSTRLATPVTIGWRKALILLPSDWESWNDAELRTALAHEMAHIARGDYAVGLLAQICVAANYYHPLVHWLARRLRLEQELAADAAAATAIGSSNDYLMTLAQLALRCDNRPVAWAARPFLPGRGALSRRIDMLRDARQVFARPMSNKLRAMTVIALAAAGILAAGVRGPTERAVMAQAEPKAKPVLNGTFLETTVNAPFDLSQIPRNLSLIVAARPARLLANEQLGKFRDGINSDMGFQAMTGLTIESIDQLVLAAALNETGVNWTRPRLVLRTKEPIDPTAYRNPIKFKTETIQGVTLYRPEDGASATMAHYFANDKTAVLGAADDLQASLNEGALVAWAPADWQAVTSSDAALWLDVKAVRPSLVQLSVRPEMQMLLMFSALWQDTETLTADITLGDTLTARAKARCANAESAERVQKTAEAAITLATNSLRSMSTPEAVPNTGRAVYVATKLLSLLKMNRDDQLVTASAETPIDSLAMLAPLVPAFTNAREQARRTQSTNEMKQLALAFHNYADAHKRFPAAAMLGPDGKTLHSWRVAILPYLDPRFKKLYEQYKLDEPWDSENNKQVLAQMPAIFRSPNDDPKSVNASFFAVTGPQTIFHDNVGTSMRQITDGTSNTILLVEAKRDIPWTKPEDIDVAVDKPLPAIGWPGNPPIVAFADGSVRTFEPKIEGGKPVPISEETLRALFTRAGKEIFARP